MAKKKIDSKIDLSILEKFPDCSFSLHRTNRETWDFQDGKWIKTGKKWACYLVPMEYTFANPAMGDTPEEAFNKAVENADAYFNKKGES